MTIKPKNIGIVGTGSRGVNSFGTWLCKNGNQSVTRLTGLYDLNKARLEEARRILGTEAPLFTDYESFLKDAPLDGVIITTPCNNNRYLESRVICHS